MIHFETQTITIVWEEECRAVRVQVRQAATLADCQMVLNKGLELMVSMGAHNWIADTRFRADAGADFVTWIAKDWRPRAIAVQLKRVAYVVAQDVEQPWVRHLRVVRKDKIPTAYFHYLEDARAWLCAYRDE
jgi:hypothetical protein